MDEVHLLLDVLSPEGGHITSAHAPLATLDGKGAGNGYPGRGENEFGDQLPSPAATSQNYNLVKKVVCGERREGCQDSAGIPPGWERTSPGLSKLKELGLIPVHWLLVGREGHLWVHSQGPWKYSEQGQWEPGLGSLREQAVRS